MTPVLTIAVRIMKARKVEEINTENAEKSRSMKMVRYIESLIYSSLSIL
jgi:hypothetical protein